MSFSGSTQPSLRGRAHQSPSMTVESLTTASLQASGAAPHRAETSAGDLAPESAQNSSSHRARKGLSPSSRSTQSQTPRASSSASSSTIAALQDLRTGLSAPPPMLTGLPQHSLQERYDLYTLCFFQGFDRVDLLSIHAVSTSRAHTEHTSSSSASNRSKVASADWEARTSALWTRFQSFSYAYSRATAPKTKSEYPLASILLHPINC